MKISLIALVAILALICPIFAQKAKVLIVFAHQEPQSFNFALRNRIYQTLVMKGHEVKFSNLVQMKMTQSLDRADFTEAFDPTYFRPQVEQLHANLNNRTTFSKELRAEHDKVEWADMMLFVFPYYVMYMPSIMKSWMERVFSYGFAYGEGHSLKGKKAMLFYTTGANKEYLKEIEVKFWDTVHGMFDFMGITPLQPFCAYQVASITEAERKAYLTEAEKIASEIEKRQPYKFSDEWQQTPLSSF